MYGPFSLESKNILVTGASSGIGKAVAIECSKAGASVILVGRNKERLFETSSNLVSGKVHTSIIADLLIESDRVELINTIEGIGGLHGVVHCAAILKKQPLKYINSVSLSETIDSNFFAPAMLTQGLVRKNLVYKQGSIVFISSIAARIASLGNISYMTSKGAINSFSRGIALELAPKLIRSNVIEPALVKTNLTEVLGEVELENYLKKFPLGRFGLPEEIAYAAIFLLSDASRWITGSMITIDGGVTLR